MESSTLNKKITPSRENYLKVLLELSDKEGVRSIDVAEALGVTKASVSGMMKRLKEEGYISKEKYGTVALTEKGFKEAEDISGRYQLLKEFLIRILGVDAQTACMDACRIEHIISTESIVKMDERLNCLSAK